MASRTYVCTEPSADSPAERMETGHSLVILNDDDRLLIDCGGGGYVPVGSRRANVFGGV